MSFEIIGTLLAAGIQGIMLSIVDSSTSCKVTMTASLSTPPNLYLNSTDYADLAAASNATGKDKLVCIYKIAPNYTSKILRFFFKERRLFSQWRYNERYLYVMLHGYIFWYQRNERSRFFLTMIYLHLEIITRNRLSKL